MITVFYLIVVIILNIVFLLSMNLWPTVPVKANTIWNENCWLTCVFFGDSVCFEAINLNGLCYIIKSSHRGCRMKCDNGAYTNIWFNQWLQSHLLCSFNWRNLWVKFLTFYKLFPCKLSKFYASHFYFCVLHSACYNLINLSLE